MKAKHLLSLLLLLPAFSFYSCNETEKPITREESMDFARKLEISIGKRDGSFMDNALNIKMLLKRAGIPNRSSAQRGFESSMKLGTAIVNSLSQKGNYTFIKEYKKDNIPHLLFRIYESGKLNYHDLELVRSNGNCQIADLYIYLSGENFSETLHGIYLQLANDFEKSSAEDESLKWTKKSVEIRSLINQNRNQEAKEIFDEIPEKYKSGKAFQIMHILICSGLSDEEYIAAIVEYKKLYPNEPNTNLIMIDGYILQKDYNKALDAVNALDKQIDKDPFLDFYRYLMYNLLQQKDKSKEYIEKLVKNEPDFGEGLLEFIATYLEDHQYEYVRPFVEKYRSRREFDQGNLDRLLMRYPDFKETNNN